MMAKLGHVPKDVVLTLYAHGSDEEAWDYATSLRGCDVIGDNDAEIKSLFTCPLRGFNEYGMDIQSVFRRYNARLISSEYIAQIVKFITEDEDRFYSYYEHYFGHVEFGYYALSKYYKIESEDLANTQEIRIQCEKCSDILDKAAKEITDYNLESSIKYILKFVELIATEGKCLLDEERS